MAGGGAFVETPPHFGQGQELLAKVKVVDGSPHPSIRVLLPQSAAQVIRTVAQNAGLQVCNQPQVTGQPAETQHKNYIHIYHNKH